MAHHYTSTIVISMFLVGFRNMKSCLFALIGLMVVCSQVRAEFMGNGNSGFGGVFGTGSLGLTNIGNTVNGVLTKGNGGFNDALVLYIDSVSGGFNSTLTFNDSADGGRRAISGFNGGNRSIVNFASGFNADYAISIENSFAGLFQISGTGSHNFISSVGLSPTGPSQSTYGFSFNLSSIGLNAGQSFNFVGTYLNSSNAFRSNEGFGAGLPSTNPGYNTATFTNSLTFSSVPEPCSLALFACGTTMVVFRRRRSRKGD